jgi:hypothetical protein
MADTSGVADKPESSLGDIIEGTNLDGAKVKINIGNVADEIMRKGGVLRVGDIDGPLGSYDADTQEKIVGRLFFDYDIAPIRGTNVEQDHPGYWVLKHQGKGYSREARLAAMDSEEAALITQWLNSSL